MKDRLPVPVRFVIVAAAEGVIGMLASEGVQRGVADPGTRDAGVIGIWALVIVSGTIVLLAWANGGRKLSSVRVEPPTSDANLDELRAENDRLRAELKPHQDAQNLSILDGLIQRGKGIAYDYRQAGPPLAMSEADRPRAWNFVEVWESDVSRFLAGRRQADADQFMAPINPSALDRTSWFLEVNSHMNARLLRLEQIRNRQATFG